MLMSVGLRWFWNRVDDCGRMWMHNDAHGCGLVRLGYVYVCWFGLVLAMNERVIEMFGYV